ncbi:MAG: preprotein translocase subunit YajC [Clostridiales bacterium]|nr:MAG: preprotein translocase subunit YajC [Clostridiales bacterium]
MLSQLTVGDKILTIGGIHGKITAIKRRQTHHRVGYGRRRVPHQN